MSEKKPTIKDLDSLCDKALDQLQEDRTAIIEQYDALRAILTERPEQYAISGDTLAKYAELRLKQSAQLIEIMKLAAKKNPENEELSDEEVASIYKEIKGK